MDYGPLRQEIAKQQYAGLTDSEIAASLNVPTGLTARRLSASKDSVSALAQVIALSIAAAPDAVRTKWEALFPSLAILLAGVSGGLLRSNLPALDAAISDGLISAETASGPWINTNASRFEELYGADEIVSEQQIGEARNG